MQEWEKGVPVIAGVALLILRKSFKKPTLSVLLLGAGGGMLDKMGNLLLLIALAVLPASVQYPFVTGGVMITSTLFAAIAGQKPTRQELLALSLSFVGLIALVLIPI